MERFRLQGWTDDYFEKAQFVNSDSQLYKQAGNGVTVSVIQAIAEKLRFAQVRRMDIELKEIDFAEVKRKIEQLLFLAANRTLTIEY